MIQPSGQEKEARKSLLQILQELPHEKKERFMRILATIVAVAAIAIWVAAFPLATHMNESNDSSRSAFGIGDALRSGAGAFSANMQQSLGAGNAATSTEEATSTDSSSTDEQEQATTTDEGQYQTGE